MCSAGKKNELSECPAASVSAFEARWYFFQVAQSMTEHSKSTRLWPFLPETPLLGNLCSGALCWAAQDCQIWGPSCFLSQGVRSALWSENFSQVNSASSSFVIHRYYPHKPLVCILILVSVFWRTQLRHKSTTGTEAHRWERARPACKQFRVAGTQDSRMDLGLKLYMPTGVLFVSTS